jgi:hypothetical protein
MPRVRAHRLAHTPAHESSLRRTACCVPGRYFLAEAQAPHTIFGMLRDFRAALLSTLASLDTVCSTPHAHVHFFVGPNHCSACGLWNLGRRHRYGMSLIGVFHVGVCGAAPGGKGAGGEGEGNEHEEATGV